MNIFIERFLLAILAALAVLLAVTNPMQFSVTSRIIGVIIIIFILAGIAAYFSELIQRRRVQREQVQHDKRGVKAMPIVAILPPLRRLPSSQKSK
jgi:small-conductance mechanosensitive channel